ncbi:ATPase [Microbacterium sp.]|uniref:ATPase n=1 Tax=Microbacterium sp. TaxID=51671 RepID=UPI003A8D1CF7
MKKLLWFLVGVAAGFVLAHFVNKDPRGREVLAEVDARIAEFTERIGDAYRLEDARLGGTDAAAAASGSTPAA